MIASLRGVIVLAAVAVALAVAVIVAPAREPASVDRALRPRADTTPITQLVFEPAGGTPVTVTRDEHQHWRLAGGGDADASTIDAVLTALDGARWHRRADAKAAAPLRGHVQVGEGAGALRIGIGRELPGADQAWLVRGSEALLVDGWVVRALWPDVLALRVRRPFAAAATASAIYGPEVAFEGRLQTAPIRRWIAEAAFGELTAALADLAFVALDGVRAGPPGPTIRIKTSQREQDSIEATAIGTCSGERVFLGTTRGDGCVERAAWQAALAAFQPYLLAQTTAVVDTRPAPFSPIAIGVAPDVRIAFDGKPHLEGSATGELDLDRVSELVAALRTPGTLVERPSTPPRATLELTAADHTHRVTLALFDGIVARDDERFALRISPQAMAILARPLAAYLDTTRWREDPITLTSFVLDRVTYTRGAVVGEWTREPAGRVDAALVDALVSAVSTVRAPAAAAPRPITHRLAITFEPPTGAPVTHTLEIGPATMAGCTARVDSAPVQLDLELCTAVAAVAATR